MPDLLIRIKKKNGGAAALTALRPDGSWTWQQQNGQTGRVFPLHDLTHYAVETTLGSCNGFFGLVSQGWEMTDFGSPWPKGRPPLEAVLIELLVGYFDLERMTETSTSAAEINQRIAAAFPEGTQPHMPFRIDDEHVERIHRARADLFARWAAVPVGDSLELPFDRRAGLLDTNAMARA